MSLQPKAGIDVRPRRANAIGIVRCEVVDGIEPIGNGSRRIPAVDVIRHAGFDLIHHIRDDPIESAGLKRGVDEIGIAIDKTMTERLIVQDSIKHLTV